MVNDGGMRLWRDTGRGSREDRPHIVVIDDSPSIRKFVTRNLARRGYHIAAASSVEAARNMLALRPPRLVILEPQMGGSQEFLRVLAGDANLAGAPLILFTTQNLFHPMGLCDYPWVAGVLFKPSSAADLVEMVDRVTGKRRIMSDTELLW